MATGAAVVAVAGGVLQAYAAIEEGKAQAKALRSDAKSKQDQAQEILNRNQQDILATKQDADLLIGEQQAAFAKGGVALGEGTTLVSMEETVDLMHSKINISMYEARYEAMLLQNSALSDMEEASDVKKASKIKAAGGLFSAAGAFSSRTKGTDNG